MTHPNHRWIVYHPDSNAAGSDDAETLAQRSQLHSLQLELAQRDQQIANLQDELERLRTRQERLLHDTLQTRLGATLSALAAPAVQIATQDYLAGQGAEIQARDVLAVARRMLRELARAGLEWEGTLGGCVPYDPTRHTLSGGDMNIQPGQPVIVRFVGAAFEGRILHKAVVEVEQRCQDV